MRPIPRDAIEQDKGFAESESPLFVGRAIVALATDPNLPGKSGGVFSSWGLAREYGFDDHDGRRPHWDEFLDAWVEEILERDAPTADERMILGFRGPQLDFDPARADDRARIHAFLRRHRPSA